MLDSLLHVTIFGVCLGELSMGLCLLRSHISLDRDVEEFLEILNRFHQVTLLLVNVTNFLIAFSLLWLVVGSLGGLQTLLEVIEGFLEIVLFLHLICNSLIDTHQFLTDFLFQFILVTFFSLSEGRYQILHCMVYVVDLLLADTETHVSLGLSLEVLVLDTDVQAFLVEVGGRLVIVKIFKLLGDSSILLKAGIYILAAEVILSIYEVVTQFLQTIFRLLEWLLLDPTKFVVVLLRNVWLDLRGCGVRRDIVEVHVRLEVTFLHQID